MSDTGPVPLVTFGIISHNRRDDLRRTIRILLDDAYSNKEVLVLDNASTDGTREMLRTEFESLGDMRLRLIHSPVNTGATGGRNIIFGEAQGKYLFSLDDDSYPSTPDLVGRIVSHMEQDPTLAAICCACVHPVTGFDETRGIERFASRGNAESGYEVVNIAGGGSLYRMEDVRQTSGFEDDFFYGREENDIAFQMLQNGKRIVYVPRYIVFHLMSGLNRDSYERLMYVTRNTYFLLWKYFPIPVAITGGFLFGIRRLLPVIKDIGRFRPVVRGIRAGVAGLFRMRRKKRLFTLVESYRLRMWFAKMLHE